jgi:hypothetical protein
MHTACPYADPDATYGVLPEVALDLGWQEVYVARF